MEPTVLIGFLGLFAYGTGLLALMKWGQPKRGFPYCRQCYKTCRRTSAEGKRPPAGIKAYLDDYQLPEHAASRYVCPRGHTEVWYAPRFGDAERGVLISKDL